MCFILPGASLSTLKHRRSASKPCTGSGNSKSSSSDISSSLLLLDGGSSFSTSVSRSSLSAFSRSVEASGKNPSTRGTVKNRYFFCTLLKCCGALCRRTSRSDLGLGGLAAWSGRRTRKRPSSGGRGHCGNPNTSAQGPVCTRCLPAGITQLSDLQHQHARGHNTSQRSGVCRGRRHRWHLGHLKH